MSNSHSSSRIFDAILVVSLAVVLAGATVAHAEALTLAQRAELELRTGKDYVAAWAAARRAVGPTPSEAQLERVRKAEAVIDQGKDYVAAYTMTSHSTAPDERAEAVAKAKRVQEALSQGKDYVTALREADRAPATRAPALRMGPTQAGGAREGMSATK